jgi:uncharacterized protein (TIGR02145 family)
VPTETEWEYLEEYLYDDTQDGTGCRDGDWDKCTWAGWQFHTWNPKSIIERLQLPLWGQHDTSNFRNRGHDADYWSSTTIAATPTKAYTRHFFWEKQTVTNVWSENNTKTWGLSIRCIKN